VGAGEASVAVESAGVASRRTVPDRRGRLARSSRLPTRWHGATGFQPLAQPRTVLVQYFDSSAARRASRLVRFARN
jgi:hypothetical protein